MPSTFIRVSTIKLDAQTRLQFNVDGNPSDPEVLEVAPEKHPLDAFMNMVSNPAVPTTVVTDAGDALVADLMKHANLSFSLTSTLNDPPAQRRIHVEIQKRASAAHNYPWEVLHNADGFLATTPGVAFVRVVPVADNARKDAAVFGGTLKILAVIAAAGVDGTKEWEALDAGLRRWTGPLECRVLVHSPALKTLIEDAPNKLVGVQCDMVPLDSLELTEMLDQFLPHICHIFCHGQADKSPRLEIANNATNFGNPPLFLSAAELAPHLKSAWLVTLNACSSGAAVGDINVASIASELVELGVPMVVAMRQVVPVTVANRFTRSFFSLGLHKLDADFKQQQSFVFDLNEAVVGARRAIVGDYGGPPVEDRIKEWTLPIVCSGSKPFEIRMPEPGAVIDDARLARTESEIAVYKNALETGGWSDAKRAEIEARIAELQNQMEGAAASPSAPGSQP